MRTLIAVAALLLACNDDHPSGAGAPADMTVPVDAATCPPGCGDASCAGGEECVAASTSFRPSQCLLPCAVTGDCPSGRHCVDVQGLYPERYCIDDKTPFNCDCPTPTSCACDVFAFPSCSGSVLKTPYWPKSIWTCGLEYIECGDLGCSDAGHCGA